MFLTLLENKYFLHLQYENSIFIIQMKRKALKTFLEVKKEKETVTYPDKTKLIPRQATLTGSNGVPGSMLNSSFTVSTDAIYKVANLQRS